VGLCLQTQPREREVVATQHFFVGQTYLGSRLIPDFRTIPGIEVRRHHSYALFCPRCGDIWGRLIHDGAGYTQLTHRSCVKHGDGRLSDLHEHGEPIYFEKDWPKDAVKYEFERFLEQAEKGL